MFFEIIPEIIPGRQSPVGFSVLKIKARTKLCAVEIGEEGVSCQTVNGAGQVTEEILSLIPLAGRDEGVAQFLNDLGIDFRNVSRSLCTQGDGCVFHGFFQLKNIDILVGGE